MAGISAIQRLLDNQLTSKFVRSLKHSDLPEVTGAAKMAANPVVRGVGMELADKPLLGAGIGGLLGLLGYDYEEE